jgi:hypothetical protein
MWTLLKKFGLGLFSTVSKYRVAIVIATFVATYVVVDLRLKASKIIELEKEVVLLEENELRIIGINEKNVSNVYQCAIKLRSIIDDLDDYKEREKESILKLAKLRLESDKKIGELTDEIKGIRGKLEENGEYDCLNNPLPDDIIELFKKASSSGDRVS